MRQTFAQYLVEFRIPVPQSTLQQAMNIVASAYLSYVAYLRRKSGGKLGRDFQQEYALAQRKYGEFDLHDFEDEHQNLAGTIQFNTGDLPDRYRSGMKLKQSYPIKIDVGNHGEGTKNGAAYYPMGRGSSAQIQVNLASLPNMGRDLEGEHMEHDLEELENMLRHELQHATQDVVLRKKHPEQMALPSEDDREDTYYASDIEFQPQITTAAGDFKRLIRGVRQKMDVSPEQLQALFKAFVHPNAQMPQGFLRYKPQFQNKFFNSLYNSNPQKWKKAVKELHRLST